MTYQISLSEQDYAALAAAAVRNGTEPVPLPQSGTVPSLNSFCMT
ncbi:MAG TPA: hypothetical protein VKU38_14845 [Ktedonobacteraceae bacterium]|nr:hypothetical protein [Ktedonobacteraceae bacterium]